jgi:uncharacterized protein
MFYFFAFLIALVFIILAIAYLGSNYLMARCQPDAAASPADYGLAYEDIEFASGDGTILRGWYVPARHLPHSHSASLRGLSCVAQCGPAPAARTVIICSGVSGSIDADVAVLPWFHLLDLNVLTFDWRAHGRSDGHTATLGYDERYDLLAAVEFAKVRGAAHIGVLGFSLGGAVALSTAAVCPDIRAVAADSAYVRVTTAVAAGLRERGLPESIVHLLARLMLLTAGARTGRNWSEADPVRWIAQVAPKPVLLLYGERDPFAPRTEVDLLYQRAGDPKELWRVSGAAHREIQVLQPEAYRQRLTRFFEDNLR